MSKLYKLMTYASALAMAMAVLGAGARSAIMIHEPKVPAKLRRD